MLLLTGRVAESTITSVRTKVWNARKQMQRDRNRRDAKARWEAAQAAQALERALAA
jgi:hypothetical protein